MGKKGKTPHLVDRNPKRKKLHVKYNSLRHDMDDEIDAFHKQRDLIPLDVNDNAESSDDDEEVPVFDLEDAYEDKDESDEEDEDYVRDTGLAAKIVRQQKFLKEKFGDIEDAMDDDEEEEEEEKPTWGGKNTHYDADNVDFELQSSDAESLAEEEAEVIRLQKEKAKSMSMADFGIEDSSDDGSDKELTLKEMSVKGKNTRKALAKRDMVDDMDATVEVVEKDLNSLSREELMDVLQRSAPELIGLLSDLNDATEELESKVDPLLSKVENGAIKLEGGTQYLELKKQLLLLYCQAIVFYLLLKAEGQPVHDHPVMTRLVEIKSLLDKTKELDSNCPMDLEEILNRSNMMNLGKENVISAPDSLNEDHEPVRTSTEEIQATIVSTNNAEAVNVELLKETGKKAEKRKRQDDHISAESMQMLRVRAALEEKLKQKRVSVAVPNADKPKKLGKLLNQRFETYDDFDDDTVNANGPSNGLANGRKSSLSSSKVSQLIAAKINKPKIISGDENLPMRDDIGERRRKHELRVLSRARIAVDDEEADGDVDMEEEESGGEDEFYKRVKQERAAKLAAKAEIYSRTAKIPSLSLPEATPTDGRRRITTQMEKNRGLTRHRKKLTKNPRKKYKLKHEKAVKNRGGQVRQVVKPMRSYGGESAGINAAVSHSIRFKY